jgi:protein-serine/threonine kinase
VEPSVPRSRGTAPEAQSAASAQRPTEPARHPADAPALNLNKPLPGHFPRSTSDNAALTGSQMATMPQGPRPATGGSMNSFGNTGRLPSRGSYGQPVAPTVTATNTEGRLAQPKSRQFALAQDSAQASSTSIPRPSTHNQQLPPTFNTTPRQEPPKGHKRSNTVSSLGEKLFGRSGSILGGRTQSNARTKQDKRYPPVSMKEPVPRENSRMSVDSRRSMQYPHNRKQSESGAENRPRRFSLLPQSFSFRGFSNARAPTPEETSQTPRPVDPRAPQRPATGPASPNQNRARATSYGTQDAMGVVSERSGEEVQHGSEPLSYEAHIDQQFADLGSQFSHQNDSFGMPSAEQVYQNSADPYSGHQNHRSKPSYYDDYNSPYDNVPRQSMQVGRSGRGPGVLQKSHRKFADAYEYERDGSHHSGSSGAARKVMDFFRRRAKSRAGDDR